MEDVKDLIGRLMNHVDGSSFSDEELKRQINAIYSIYASIMGSEQIIVQASRYNALKYIHDENPRIRLIGMERLILESRDYTRVPTEEEIPSILDKLEDKLAEMLARQAVERQLEEKIADRLEERHQEYVDEIRQEIINEETGDTETPQSRRKMEKLEALDKVKLTSTIMNVVRPRSLSEIVGQDRAVKALFSRIASPYPQHLILYGPPGLGKTTLSGIIANEMGVHMKVTSGPAIEKPGEMAAILNNLQEGDILFVDEIHRLNRQVEEVLYPAMEDFAIDIMIGKGASARSIRLDLPKFTLVGATTRAGLLSAPLRDRFGVIHHLEFYSKKELTTIIMRSAQVLGVEIDVKGAGEIAMRSRGTPRLANRLLKRVRDFAQVKYDGRITYDVACFALNLLEVDQYGLDKLDRQILTTLIVNFKGGPVGLDTLAAAIGEDSGTLEDVYEPYLLKNGFLNRTPRGRMASALAYEHLGFPVPET